MRITPRRSNQSGFRRRGRLESWCGAGVLGAVLASPAGATIPWCQGDANFDGRIGLADIAQVILHWDIDVTPFTKGDVNGGGHTGLDDLAEIILNWGHQCCDCNGNGIEDAPEVRSGQADDCNQNGIPDDCDQRDCRGDLNGDGVIDNADRAIVAANLGVIGATYCQGDLDGDGAVTLADVQIISGLVGTACTSICRWCDCNNNGRVDIPEIAGGGAIDSNGNFRPDECDRADCAGDINGDSYIDQCDADIVQANFGLTGATLAQGDANGDGVVDATDLQIVAQRLGDHCLWPC